MVVQEITLFNHDGNNSSAITFPSKLTTVMFSPLTKQFMANIALDIDTPWFTVATYEFAGGLTSYPLSDLSAIYLKEHLPFLRDTNRLSEVYVKAENTLQTTGCPCAEPHLKHSCSALASSLLLPISQISLKIFSKSANFWVTSYVFRLVWKEIKCTRRKYQVPGLS